MPVYQDGPRSPQFAPVALRGLIPWAELAAGVSAEMAAAIEHAPDSDYVC